MTPWVPRVVLAALGVAVLGAVISISVGEGGPEPPRIEGLTEVQALYAGVPQDGARVGEGEAPVTIEVFTDLNCSDCADYQLEVVDPLVERYARGDEVRLVLRHYSLSSRETTLAALAATAAGEQGRQWQFADAVFRNQDQARGAVDEEFLRRVADALPELDVEAWLADREEDATAEQVEADAEAGAALELTGEGPSVIVSGPLAESTLQGSPSLEEVEAAVAAAS